jgi:methyl-accepting chemotaxis protein
MAIFNNLKIFTKILTGMMLVAGVFAVVVVLNLGHLDDAGMQAEEIATISHQVERTMAAKTDVVDLSRVIRTYFQTLSEDDAQRASTLAATLRAHLGNIANGQSVSGPLEQLISNFQAVEGRAKALYSLKVDQVTPVGIEVRKHLSAANKLAKEEFNFQLSSQIGTMQEKLLLARLRMQRYFDVHNDKDLDGSRKAIQELDELIKQEKARGTISAAVAAELDGAVAMMPAWLASFDAAVVEAQAVSEYLGTTLQADEKATIAAISVLSAAATGDIDQSVAKAMADISEASVSSMIAAAAAAVVALLLSLFLGRMISRGVTAMTDLTTDLAAGNTKKAIPYLESRDEIGAMARAMDVLRREVNEAFRLRQMVEMQPSKVMLCNPENLFVTYANKAARDLLDVMLKPMGKSSADAVGASINQFHKNPQMVERLLRDPKNLPYKGKFSMAGMVIENHVTAIFDRDGQYLGPMLNWEDVTKYVKLADEFEVKVRAVASSVSDAAEALTTAATEMGNISAGVSERAAGVASAAEEMGVNVRTVSHSTEQLSAAEAEIAHSVNESTSGASEAADAVNEAVSTVEGLERAAVEIGEVVQLITDIAEQTNLLALNATIEAARAGDAGKGFAVVANEVKQLANQTARATEDIRSKVGDIQTATRGAVASISGVRTTIQTLRELSTTVAAAVEEQSASTHEISMNIQQAAAAADDVTENIANVAEQARMADLRTHDIETAAGALSRDATMLEDEVERFLHDMRNQ